MSEQHEHKPKRAARPKRQRDIVSQLDRRLMEEINILRLEGAIFCFDRHEAKRRRGTLTLTDTLGQRPVTVRLHPDHGQPSVLAYKVLQAVFQKITDEGVAMTDDGRAVFSDTASFSNRELALVVGRAWSGVTSQQLMEAIRQLRSTQLDAWLLDKETGEWQLANFEILNSAYFAGHGATITRCSVRLAPEVMASINKRHVAFFNLCRLNALEPLGMVLYKRIFYHLSNLNQGTRRRNDLKFTKDYETICNEWLGRLKPRAHLSLVKQQLEPHLDALKATGLIRRWNVEKNAAGDGFNVTVWPGDGFFEDYQLYYVDRQQPCLRFQATADLRTIQKPLELVAAFHREVGHDLSRFEEHETAYADELLERYDEHEIRDLIRYAAAAARETNFDMRYFGAVKRFVGKWAADKERQVHREIERDRIGSCPYCNEQGYLNLRERHTQRFFVLACPHNIEHIAKIEEHRDAERL